jgi:UDP-N-acetylmuramate--alanine ligase
MKNPRKISNGVHPVRKLASQTLQKQILSSSLEKGLSNGVHFIGIGGIGVSALAQYYLDKDYKITGSDLFSSEIIKILKNKGIKIRIGKHKKENLPKNASLVIYSPAVKKNNLELIEAKKLKIKIQSYPEALGQITKQYFTIAVSGTHGKSTTASMLGLLLIKAKLDPTVIIGTKLKEFKNSNYRTGKSKYLIIEADEHFASFLNYQPQIIVITNIEADHLDYYKNLKNYILTFKKFILQLPKTGILVFNNDDKNICQNISKIAKNKQFFSLKQKQVKKLRKILKIPGEHNISNALAVLTVARILKIPDKISFKALSEYKSSWRRFEIKQSKLNNKKITIISDYGHHPTEIKATLEAAREKYPKKKIWCIYQPHQYQRTHYLFSDFIKIFKQASNFIEKIIITDIYDVAGREQKNIKKKVNSQKLIEKINKPFIVYLPNKSLVKYLKQNIKEAEVMIIMGAGDIYQLAINLTEKRNKNKI